MLVFIQETVVWRCNRHETHEQLDDPVPLDGDCYLHPMVFGTIESGPALRQYGYLVQDYNKRTLSNDDDGLAAFMGVLEAITPLFAGEFTGGLPNMYFDTALLWQPNHPLKRRAAGISGEQIVPSWSWAGWEGGLDLALWDRKQGEVDIHPLVRWKLEETEAK